MRLKRAATFAGVLVTALAMTAQSAGAGTWYTFSLANTAHDANSNGTSTTTYGSYRAKSQKIALDPGFVIAWADDANSPLTPAPQDGDIVGEGSATAKWVLLFCGHATQSLTARWKEPIDSGAPAGTKAQINVANALGFTTKVYVEQVSSDSHFNTTHYVLDIPDMPDEQVCSSTTDGASTLTTYGTVANTSPTRIVSKNPSTTGSKTIYIDYVDTSNVTHSDSDTETIT